MKDVKRNVFQDRDFYQKMISLAVPITVQNLISTSLNMVDTVMIGRLGEANIAAVGLGNQFFFLLSLLLFGINSGSSIFFAQFWGKQDIKNIRKVLGLALLFGGSASVLFSLGAFFVPRLIFRLFTADPLVIELGSQYLRIVGLSYLFTAVSFSFSFASRSIGQVNLPMIVSAVSLGTNTVLNYLLIFGHFGFPQMGVAGAALATVIARLVEVFLLLFIIYRHNGVLASRLMEMFQVSSDFVRHYLQTTLPVILNEGFWSLGMTMYSAAYARIGTEAIAAVQISNTVQSIFMVIFFGLAHACAVMVGNEIGANHRQRAIDYAKKYSLLGPVLGVVIGLALFVFSPAVLSLFKVSEAVFLSAKRILAIMSLLVGIRVFNIILIVGILRSGGDTRFSMYLEIGSVWLIGVPLVFLGALVLHLPVYWVVALASLEEVVKAAIGIPRVISQKWVRNLVSHVN